MASPRVVLCVDGESEILSGHRFVLSIAGYEVVPASDAEEALQLLSYLSVDLVVLDESLPDMPGITLGQIMKGIRPHLPIVLITRSPERPPSGSNFVDLLVSRDSYPTEFLAAVERVVAVQPAIEAKAAAGNAAFSRAL